MIPSYVDIVVQLDPSRAVEFDFFERLPDNIVGLTLGLLRRLDDGGFVQVALVVDIQLAERVGQREDFILLELRIFSRGPSVLRVTCCVYMRKKGVPQAAVFLLLELEDVHVCDCQGADCAERVLMMVLVQHLSRGQYLKGTSTTKVMPELARGKTVYGLWRLL